MWQLEGVESHRAYIRARYTSVAIKLCAAAHKWAPGSVRRAANFSMLCYYLVGGGTCPITTFSHQKPHVEQPGIETGPPRCEIGD
jgi:hypothetical protein